MSAKLKVFVLLLGISTISIWSIVIFLFFFNDQAPTAGTHSQAEIRVTQNKEAAFENRQKSADRVYTINDKTAYNSRKISSISDDGDSRKVSIDVLLEELNLN